jgi:hypothetical protein
MRIMELILQDDNFSV